MKRDVFPTGGTVAPRSTARTCIQHGVFLAPLCDTAACLEPAGLERSAGSVTPHSIEPGAKTWTLGIDLARKEAANFDGGSAVRMFAAGPEKTSLEQPQNATDCMALRLASRGQACESPRLPAPIDVTQRLKCSRVRFRALIAKPFTTVCVNRAWARVAGGHPDICYSPSSHELHGYFLGLLHPFFGAVGEFDGVEPKVPSHLLSIKY